jgi:hypothetical protein
MNAGAVTVRSWARRLSCCFVLLAAGALTACGGGGSSEPPAEPVTPTGANTLAITVDRGLDGAALNLPFVSVTVCVPGTTSCQTVDHVLVDTGSTGLRLMASALTPALSLPQVNHTGGVPVAECAHFATGFAWGSVRRTDVRLAGEIAASLPVQIIGDPAVPYTAVPAACSHTGANLGADLGANGILGVGVFNQDCPACVSSTAPATYFGCQAVGCLATALPLVMQVANPVRAFSVNNNGVAIVLPTVPPGGAATVSGSLIFGIGTQSNNQLGSATVYATNSLGNFTTTYKDVVYSSSFLDSGSNGIFFADPDIPQCSGFYCPPMPLTLSAVNTSATGVATPVEFTIESIQSISRNVAAAHVGGEIDLANSFDWGLPFFYGRTVFIAIAGAATPQGSGPYVAY